MLNPFGDIEPALEPEDELRRIEDRRAVHLHRALDLRGLTGELAAICHDHHVTPWDVLGRGRSRMTARARRVFWRYLRGLGFSLVEIGHLTGRDHTTILAGIQKGEREVAQAERSEL